MIPALVVVSAAPIAAIAVAGVLASELVLQAVLATRKTEKL